MHNIFYQSFNHKSLRVTFKKHPLLISEMEGGYIQLEVDSPHIQVYRLFLAMVTNVLDINHDI